MIDLTRFANKLINWGEKHGRRFPWRETDDPYKVFVAEILLHRTKAESVVPAYLEITSRYGSLIELSAADEEILYKMLKPLGLKWRVAKLIEAVNMVVKDFHGILPQQKYELERLPGIGDYISSAIRSMIYNSRDPLIDTNTVRVLSRITGWKQNDSLRRTKKVRDQYVTLAGEADFRKFGLALIDLASKICRPSNPLCEECPLIECCKFAKIDVKK